MAHHPKGRGGRPTKLDEKMSRALCADIRRGVPLALAAKFNNLDPKTITNWLEKGANDPTSIYGEFARDLAKAEGVPVRDALQSIFEHSADDPRYAQWWLSRRYPEFFGRRDNVLNQGDDSEKPDPGSVVAMLAQRLERIATVHRDSASNLAEAEQIIEQAKAEDAAAPAKAEAPPADEATS